MRNGGGVEFVGRGVWCAMCGGCTAKLCLFFPLFRGRVALFVFLSHIIKSQKHWIHGVIQYLTAAPCDFEARKGAPGPAVSTRRTRVPGGVRREAGGRRERRIHTTVVRCGVV